MDKLYAASGSTSLVAAILLEECEHVYTLEMLALYPDGAGDQSFAQINPWRQVPALVTARGMLTEVLAIADYLDAVHPERQLLPSDRWQRTQALRWYSCLSTAIQPYVRCMVRPERFVGNDLDCARKLRSHVGLLLVEKLSLVNEELADREWLSGSVFGPVDALLIALVGWAERMHLPLHAFEHLQAHAERGRARPAYVRAVSRHGDVPNLVRSSP